MNKDNYFRMGYFYQAAGDFHAAAECFIRSIENGPTAEAHTFLALVLNQLGEVKEAITECKRALKLDPNFGNALNDLGAYLIDTRNLDEAMTYLKKALKAKNYDHPEYPHYNMARIYIQKDMLMKAKEELELSLKANAKFSQAKELLDRIQRLVH